MSIVKVQGNASGTGTLTIAAPNTNSDYTVTLPTSSGTLNTSGAPNEVPAGSAAAPAIYPTGDTNTGIFFPAADTIAFAEGGAEIARFDSSGNLGIGTSSPAAKLDVAGPATTPGLKVRSGGNGGINIFDVADVNGAGRVIVDASGNLLVGTTSQAGVLTVSGNQTYFTTTSTTNASLTLRKGSAGADATDYLQCRDSGNNAEFVALANGGLGNFSGNNVNYSDERLKTDISLAGSYLSKICAIPVKNFKYKNQTDSDFTLGVVAQEVLEVAPELISTHGEMGHAEDGTPYLTIYQTDLQYALMKCIQEQQAIIIALTARVAALEGQA